MDNKDDKKKRVLTGSDIALSTLSAAAGGLGIFIVLLIVGALLFPDALNPQSSEAASVPSRTVVQSQSPESVQSETEPAEAAETPSESVSEPQEEQPSDTQEPETNGPEPSESSSSSTAPSQNQASSTPTATTRNSDGTYTHDFSGGRVLITTASDNNDDPVYHTEDCQAARQIPPESESWYVSAQAAESDGRRICGYCDK